MFKFADVYFADVCFSDASFAGQANALHGLPSRARGTGAVPHGVNDERRQTGMETFPSQLIKW
jgi:hypothetical protein